MINNSIVVIISMLFVGFIGFYQRSETQNKRSLFPFSLSFLILHWSYTFLGTAKLENT